MLVVINIMGYYLITL